MGEKGQFRRHIPAVKLWFVLCLTLTFSVVLLAAAHLTHSLTLRVEAYHALYNLLSLTGCLLTMKLCSRPESLHNTFGWARLEVLSMLTTLMFLTALCFSMAIDSIQTALHAGHQDAMHHPLHIMGLGVIGLVLNGIVFCLIGGYTHHQGCFLEIRGSGGVWVGKQLTQEAVQTGRRTLSLGNLNAGSAKERVKEVMRDISGLILVELCAAVVHWDNGETIALYIDPALAITSAAVLMWLSYPYGRECCQILLQTIPGHINVEDFKSRILDEFPDILNVHHLHIWTFTPTKVVATAHVVFLNKRVYLTTHTALRDFFLDEGVTQVTLQPEFAVTDDPSKESNVCLLRCKTDHCHEKECCRGCTSEVTPLSAVIIGEEEDDDGGKEGTDDGQPGKPTLASRTEAVPCAHGKTVCLTFKFSKLPVAGLQKDQDLTTLSGVKELEPVHKPQGHQHDGQDTDRTSEKCGCDGAKKKKKTVEIKE
ncbi:proton-coupled zinc antiporter SLC30A1 [Palaemon carinicauda]|uniref:proton-coupled zinc antiporter SLC30A1 n=1 Tax=Palaemon carinicauda TaxID=392227 RepID=UPI0035B615E4